LGVWVTDLVKAVGPTTAIALFLLWFVTQNMAALMAGLVSAMTANSKMIEAHIATTAVEQEKARYYQRLVCISVAQTSQMKSQCLAGP
jgi:hypothetical protein